MNPSFPGRLLYYVMTLLFLADIGCHKKEKEAGDPISFSTTPTQVALPVPIPEASGIADSRRNPGYLWVEEDSGNPADLSLLSHAGIFLKKIHLKDAVNNDWEDIVLANGPKPETDYLYIGDIGDNNTDRLHYSFYRLEEPAADADTINSYDEISFHYADGAHDAEAFVVDDATGDIYIITKREVNSRVYKLTYPYSTTAENTATFVATLPYNLVVSATLGKDGKGLIVKTYYNLFYYTRGSGETIPQLLQQPFVSLAYTPEPQGEAITFSNSGPAGFFTLSEKGPSAGQQLFFFQKK